MRVSLLVVLSACSIAPIDYTGKACQDGRCPAGYQCNLATNTCAENLVIDGPGSDGDSRQPDGDVVGTSCLTNPKVTLAYSSVGFADFPSGWFGNGGWQWNGVDELTTDGTTAVAWLGRMIPMADANYRIVAMMRQPVSGGTLGIAFRASTLGSMYGCVLDPAAQQLLLVYTQQQQDGTMAQRPVTVTDPRAELTMEVDVTGINMQCCIREISNASLSYANAMLTSGRAGVTAHNSTAAFTAFYAYR